MLRAVRFTPRSVSSIHSLVSQRMSMLVTPSEVKAMSPSKTAILDTTWFMPNAPKNAYEEFKRQRIPGAQFLDLDEVAEPHELGLKHMMPSSERFKQACENVGITRDHNVVLYDTHGIFSSPRALFMFKAFGHRNAYVLNGGLSAWRAEGNALDQSEATPRPLVDVHYPVPSFDSSIIRSYPEILANTKKTGPEVELVLDARSAGRFLGTAEEPRPNLLSGHMPNSLSLPFNILLKTNHSEVVGNYTTLLPPQELRNAIVATLAGQKEDHRGDLLLEKILSGEIPVIVSCGSGMTAAVIWLALQELRVNRPVALYDESWTGYALRGESPILRSAQ